jgi:hypothetical protein
MSYRRIDSVEVLSQLPDALAVVARESLVDSNWVEKGYWDGLKGSREAVLTGTRINRLLYVEVVD